MLKTKAIVSIIICSVAAFSVKAKINADLKVPQCAYLAIDSSQLDHMRIDYINGDPIYGGSKSFNKLKKSKIVKIPQGNHELIGAIFPKEHSLDKSSEPLSEELEQVVPLYFGLEVLNGHVYEFSIVRNDNKPVDIEVEIKPITSCSVENEYDALEFMAQPQEELLVPSIAQLNLIKQFFSIVKSSEQTSFQGIFPASIIKQSLTEDMPSSNSQVFVPRYQFSLNQKLNGMVNYSPLPDNIKSQLDAVIIELIATTGIHSSTGGLTNFDLSNTGLSDYRMSIYNQTPESYLAQVKKPHHLYKKSRSRIGAKTPHWWGDTQRVYINNYTSSGEQIATNTRNQ